MLILGIETSCDETAAAVVEDGQKIVSNVVASSVKFHKKSGGIIPEVAAREQVKCTIPVIDEAIENCKLKIENLDALAVTIGPGLIGSLLVGVETAKALALVWQKPIIPVNHLLAHFYAAWLDNSRERAANSVWKKTTGKKLRATRYPDFPLVGLIASGGHTELVLMKNHGNYQWLGGTRDDAAGECFDKTARILGLGYPGGPAIEKATAEKSNIKNLACRQARQKPKIELPRPMINQRNFDFSFSGLKTAVLKIAKEKNLHTPNPIPHTLVPDLASSIQEAITDVLVEKTLRAAQKFKVKSVIVAGGVAANKRLKEKFQSAISYQLPATHLFIPSPRLCTDNAAMIAACALFNFHPVPWQKIQANPTLSL